jgi:hypothetical protein
MSATTLRHLLPLLLIVPILSSVADGNDMLADFGNPATYEGGDNSLLSSEGSTAYVPERLPDSYFQKPISTEEAPAAQEQATVARPKKTSQSTIILSVLAGAGALGLVLALIGFGVHRASRSRTSLPVIRL